VLLSWHEPGRHLDAEARLEVPMTIEYPHASKFGNGALVAAEFEQLMAVAANDVDALVRAWTRHDA